MTIKVGDRLPDAKFTVMGADGPEAKTVKNVFSGKKVALFAVPGAYTPACDKNHMPGFCRSRRRTQRQRHRHNRMHGGQRYLRADALGKRQRRHRKNRDAGRRLGYFAKTIGLDIDLSEFGLGLRSKRYAMLVDDGVVKALNVEDSPPVVDKSSAEYLCSMIDRSF